MLCVVCCMYSAINEENKEMNKVKNHLTGEYGPVPDTARYYKVYITVEKDTSELINRTLLSVPNATFVYLTTSELRTPLYFNLPQWCPD